MTMHRTYVRLLYPPLIVAAVCAAWWSCYRGPFIYDDVPSIVENRALRSIRGSWRAAFPANQEDYTLAGRPVAAVTLAMSYAVSRDEIRGYRVVNVAIHIAAALVLYGILRRTLRLEPMRARFAPRADLLAAVVTLVWAVHPLIVPSVTYVVQRVESLAGLMTLLTLYSFIRARTGGSTGWYAAAMLVWAATLTPRLPSAGTTAVNHTSLPP